MNIELIGWLAGILLLMSSTPQLAANLRDPELAKHQSPARNFLQCSGNFLWLIYAIMADVQAMKVFAALGTIMAAALFMQVIYARRADTSSKV
jgi:uncharacterized protein with PQ loop repeat